MPAIGKRISTAAFAIAVAGACSHVAGSPVAPTPEGVGHQPTTARARHGGYISCAST
jgi:NaMN:DMB phosphoribosyltransferase